MKKIGVIVDSTSGMTMEESKKYEGLTMIPLQVIFGEESYLDGVTLSTNEFFEKCEVYYNKSGILPTTSQPSVGRCIELFEELLKTYDELIYYTISSKMSGTFQSGVLASQEFGGRVHVIDTYTTSVPLMLSAIKSLELIEKGLSVSNVLEQVKPIYEANDLYFVVSDLKHLQRTGRIGAAAAKIGNALQLKPVLTIVEGEVSAVEKVRNLKKAHKKIISYIEKGGISDDDCFYVVSGAADEYIDGIVEQVKQINPNTEVRTTDLSPVIGVNTGPGVVGVFIIRDYNRK